MNKKVEGLVEWVALSIIERTGREVGTGVCDPCCDFDGETCQAARPDNFVEYIGEDSICPQDFICSEALAKQILSHPDLALIDRDMTYDLRSHMTQHPIILLAEALREKG